jgi:hypothetical protein
MGTPPDPAAVAQRARQVAASHDDDSPTGALLAVCAEVIDRLLAERAASTERGGQG